MPGNTRKRSTKSPKMEKDEVLVAEYEEIYTGLMKLDHHLTQKLAICANKNSSHGQLRPLMQVLEYSMHGIPWLMLTMLGILVSHQITVHEKLFNLLIGKFTFNLSIYKFSNKYQNN